MMQKGRFEYTGYGSAFRARGANSGAQSAWWNKAVRETLNKTSPKNLTIPDPTKNSDFDDRWERIMSAINRGQVVGQKGGTL